MTKKVKISGNKERGNFTEGIQVILEDLKN